MSQKVEQWMRDAVEDIWNSSIIFKCEKDKVLEIIASHAPSDETICPQCGWDTLTRSWQHAPEPREAAAQPTVCGCCGEHARSSMGPCANTADGLHSWEFEIEHNDHH